MYPSKNFSLCLFYASEQAKVQKRLLNVYTISHGHSIFVHIQVGGLGGSGGWEESCKLAKIGPVSETAWHFGPEDLVKLNLL